MFNLYIVLLKLNIFTQLIFVNPADPHSRAAHDLINSQVRLYIPTKSICSRTARRKNLAPRFYEDHVCDTRSASRALEIAVIKKPVRARARALLHAPLVNHEIIVTGILHYARASEERESRPRRSLAREGNAFALPPSKRG